MEAYVGKTAMIRAPLEPELKQEAATGNALPSELRTPNDETLAAMRQVRSGKGLGNYSSVEEMRADLLKDA